MTTENTYSLTEIFEFYMCAGTIETIVFVDREGTGKYEQVWDPDPKEQDDLITECRESGGDFFNLSSFHSAASFANLKLTKGQLSKLEKAYKEM
jgi:hypothetical protein